MTQKLKRATSAEDILGLDDLKSEDVSVPEWNLTVTMRGLTARERDAFDMSITNAKGKVTTEDIRAKLVVWSAVKPDGSRLFTEKHVAKLSGKSGAAVDRLFAVAQRLSGMSARDIEELEKNSEGAPSADSSSD